MTFDGIKDLLPFLEFLNSRKVLFRIEQSRPDAIMVSFTLVGVRAEVEFFDDHIEYSLFHGDEWVLDDQAALVALIRQKTDD
ncbi:MAG: hypothetical protein JNK46_18680 [Methylobacteriaceae bacterium]|nr:hypothetical protein [Methylobacteriaceae bacterium]